jgi:hypothetical protein
MNTGPLIGKAVWEAVRSILLAALMFIGFIVAWCLKLCSVVLLTLSDALFKLVKK